MARDCPQTIDELIGVAAPIPRRFLEVALDLDLFAKLAGRAPTIGQLVDLWSMPEASARLMAQHLVYLGLMRFQGAAPQRLPTNHTANTAAIGVSSPCQSIGPPAPSLSVVTPSQRRSWRSRSVQQAQPRGRCSG